MILANNAKGETFLPDVSPDSPVFAQIEGQQPGQIVPLVAAQPLPWRVKDLVNSRWCDVASGRVFEVQARLPGAIFALHAGGGVEAQGIRIDLLPAEGQVTWACYSLNLIQRRYDHAPTPALAQDLELAIARAQDYTQRSHHRLFRNDAGAWHHEPLPTFQPGEWVRVTQSAVGLESDLGRLGQVQTIRENDGGLGRVKVRLQGDPLARFFAADCLEPAHAAAAARIGSLRAEIAALEQEERNLLAEGRLQQGWIETYSKTKNGNEYGPYYTLVTPQPGERPRKVNVHRKDVAEFREAIKRRQRVDAIHDRLEIAHREVSRLADVAAGDSFLRQPLDPKAHGEYEIWDTRQGYAVYPHKTFSIMVFRWLVSGDIRTTVRGPILFRRRLSVQADSYTINKAMAAARAAIERHRR